VTPDVGALVDESLIGARRIARRIARAYDLDRDDAEGVALEALVLAARAFNPALPSAIPFQGWYRKRVAGAVLDMRWPDRHTSRRAARRSRALGLPLPVRVPLDDFERTAASPGPPPDVMLERAELLDACRVLSAALEPLDREILRLVYLDAQPISLRQASRALAKDYVWITRVHNRAIDALRRQLVRAKVAV